jgi:HAD superfamily hydrolase (TIGR01509 family)
MIEAVIFDCFGVIITDSLHAITTDLRSRDEPAAREIDDIVRANNRGMIGPAESNRRIAAVLGMSEEEFRIKVADGEVKDQTLLKYIASLRDHYKTAMLSNIGVASLQRRFSDQELAKHFDSVVVSGEIGYAKPEPEAYEITADRLGVRLESCVFTDDRQAFCEAARGVGMQAIVYESFDQFRQDLKPLLTSW